MSLLHHRAKVSMQLQDLSILVSQQKHQGRGRFFEMKTKNYKVTSASGSTVLEDLKLPNYTGGNDPS